MTRYFVATFPDGSKATRSSAHGQYSHAWRVTPPADVKGDETIGFASRRDLAVKAGDDHANGWSGLSVARSYTSKRRPRFASPAYYQHRREAVARHGGAEAWIAETTKLRAGFRVEIAEAVEVDRATYSAARK